MPLKAPRLRNPTMLAKLSVHGYTQGDASEYTRGSLLTHAHANSHRAQGWLIYFESVIFRHRRDALATTLAVHTCR